MDSYSTIFHAGVGLWGTSESLPNNGAFVADANGQISTISCHTASRDPLTSQWVGPLGTDITFDLTDPFAIDARSGAFPSFSSFELGAGQSLSSADQGIYSCVIPDENGVEHTLNIGLYPQEYSGEVCLIYEPFPMITLLKMGRYYNTTMRHYWDMLVK